MCGIKIFPTKHHPICRERRMSGWHEGGDCLKQRQGRVDMVCAWSLCVSQLNSFSMCTGEVEGYRYCVALRIVSLPLYHTPSRSYPQTESGGPGLFHSWLWQRNGARGPLLLLIRADAWLSCMPAAQPNRDYVPGWWRQKKKGHCWDLCLSTPLASLRYCIILLRYCE